MERGKEDGRQRITEKGEGQQHPPRGDLRQTQDIFIPVCIQPCITGNDPKDHDHQSEGYPAGKGEMGMCMQEILLMHGRQGQDDLVAKGPSYGGEYHQVQDRRSGPSGKETVWHDEEVGAK